MSGPADMNIVLFQTPTVEKMQQSEAKNPDQTQRQSAVQEMA